MRQGPGRNGSCLLHILRVYSFRSYGRCWPHNISSPQNDMPEEGFYSDKRLKLLCRDVRQGHQPPRFFPFPTQYFMHSYKIKRQKNSCNFQENRYNKTRKKYISCRSRMRKNHALYRAWWFLSRNHQWGFAEGLCGGRQMLPEFSVKRLRKCGRPA